MINLVVSKVRDGMDLAAPLGHTKVGRSPGKHGMVPEVVTEQPHVVAGVVVHWQSRRCDVDVWGVVKQCPNDALYKRTPGK